MCNGSHRMQWIHSNKPNLAPYTKVTDKRFAEFESKLKYLKDWRQEVYASPKKTEAQKKAMILAQQTLDAWEMICLAMPACIKFLLNEGTKFVMARVFCQDPLEQHFSKQRASCGGNKNPNVAAYLHNESTIHLQGKLRLKRRGANTETSRLVLDDTPLPKRKKVVKRCILPE